jgi:predicted HNH restriction endonuclease
MATREYHREHARAWYHANKERAAVKAKAWRLNNLDYIKTKQREDKRKRKEQAVQYLGGKCQKCNGEFHPAVYEFHHTNPETKDRDPSKMLSLKWERVTAELDKCLLLCANCHRLTHYEDTY